MLYLTRKIGQFVEIGNNQEIKIMVTGIRGNQVVLGFEAPPDVPIHRKEIWDKILEKDTINQSILSD